MRVVLDANVVFAGAGCRGEARQCLVAMARRQIIVFATNQILREVRGLFSEIGFKAKFPPENTLNIEFYVDGNQAAKFALTCPTNRQIWPLGRAGGASARARETWHDSCYIIGLDEEYTCHRR